MTEFLTATIFPPHSEEPDAEPVLLEADDKNVTLTLDAGEQIVFDRAELEAALARASNRSGRAAA